MDSKENIIDKLSQISTPIIYDAIEKFNLRSRCEGYTDCSIKAMSPQMGPVCGYACTGKITGALPPCPTERVIPSKEVWRYVYNSSKPSIMIVQDLDEDPKRACAWGDYAAAIFYAMGCRGAITNGFVRDVEAVEKIGFKMFARSEIVGHGYIRYTEIDAPVRVGGLIIKPGQLLHADRHGVVIIPQDIDLVELLDKANLCLKNEGLVISYCNSSEFTLDGLFKIIEGSVTL